MNSPSQPAADAVAGSGIIRFYTELGERLALCDLVLRKRPTVNGQPEWSAGVPDEVGDAVMRGLRPPGLCITVG